MRELVIATTNAGKFQEIASFLSSRFSNARFVSLRDLKNVPTIIEDGSTFLENAQKKANLIASFSGRLTLADDSGLEVEGLGGRPGVLSARFAGPNASDTENVRKMIEKVRTLNESGRKARFRCTMVLKAPNGKVATAIGDVAGWMTEEPKGQMGFGYDPIFFIPSLRRTMAELTLSEKNEISHRAIALRKIAEHLNEFWQ